MISPYTTFDNSSLARVVEPLPVEIDAGQYPEPGAGGERGDAGEHDERQPGDQEAVGAQARAVEA